MGSILLVFVLVAQHEFFEAETERDYEVVISELERQREEPADLNAVTMSQLARLPYLSIVTAYRIVEYRESNGPYDSLEGLLKVEGMDPSVLEAIRPYLRVKTKASSRKTFWGRYRYLNRIDQAPGNVEVYSRTIMQYRGLKSYLVTEKDFGEEDNFDYTGYGLVANLGRRRFALGSYGLEFGRGVVYSSHPTIFEGSTYRILSGSRGIVPYTSVLENSGFFGAAYSDSLFASYTLFYSDLGLDARLDTAGRVTSLDPDGDHIDSLSMSRKNNLREVVLGGNIEQSWSATTLGLRTYYLRYNREFAPDDSQHSFYGDAALVAGLSAAYVSHDLYLFSEVARAWNNRWGGTAGLVGDYKPLEVSMVLSYFASGFYSPKGEMADEGAAGATLNLAYRLGIAHLSGNLKVSQELKSDTSDYVTKLRAEMPLGPLTIKLQLKREFEAGSSIGRGSTASLSFVPAKSLCCYVRVDDKYVHPAAVERGFGYLGGARARFWKMSLEGRYGRFSTDSYDTRLYVYEPDLTGIINNRNLYGEGSCWFVLAGFGVEKFLDLEAKYSIIEKEVKDGKLGVQLELKL